MFLLLLLLLCDLTKSDKAIVFYFTACPSFGVTGIKTPLYQLSGAIMVFPWGWIIFRGICNGGFAALCVGARNVPTQVAKRVSISLSPRCPATSRSSGGGWPVLALCWRTQARNPEWRRPCWWHFAHCSFTWRCSAGHRPSRRGNQNLRLAACLSPSDKVPQLFPLLASSPLVLSLLVGMEGGETEVQRGKGPV